MKIGIVGSRRRISLDDRRIVQEIIKKAHERFGTDLVIVSGHCSKGADSFAEEYAKLMGIKVLIFPITNTPPVQSKGEFVQRAFQRNRLIAENSDVIFALVHPDRTGGTENTLKHTEELGKRFFLV